MGAKQSKRSVDISGKEAEGAGEVAAAGAGGEGRLESIADADTLKPQLNGDAQHIEPPEEITDKEKQLDSGTPENEKDATTEKEIKNQENEKEATPVTNGDSEAKPESEKENGEATPEQEGKKPKKEKVKKKWSLRSISFSRKDKPKQEKKQKDDEPKTNGDAEKLPEEAAESVAVESVEKTETEIKSEPEAKDDKTPETPVTEPITNGSSTPESPKVESVAREAAAAASPAVDRPEATPVAEPEQLPLNGLSLQEPKKEVAEVPETVESKPEEPVAEPEPVPAPEIPVKSEVCVETVPLVESTPPPLPANPPPSSVASFAATTMAPELTDAALANTATEDSAPAIPITETSPVVTAEPQISAPKDTVEPTLPPPPQTCNIDELPAEVITDEPISKPTEEVIESPVVVPDVEIPQPEVKEPEAIDDVPAAEMPAVPTEEIPAVPSDEVIAVPSEEIAVVPAEEISAVPSEEISTVPSVDIPVVPESDEKIDEPIPEPISEDKVPIVPISQGPMGDVAIEPIVSDEKTETIVNNDAEIISSTVVNSNHISSTIEANGLNGSNGTDDEKLNYNETEQENLKNKTKDAIEIAHDIECNGNGEEPSLKQMTKELKVPVSEIIEEAVKIAEEKASLDGSLPASPPSELAPPPADDLSQNVDSAQDDESFPLPPESPAASPQPQDALPVHDKIADLIPEVPDLPTETLQETASDVAVVN
ncbi:unnamed protein product [Plutella xylostella]|uniref:(diamondback moth) hypothetical protein n=1 Tax=Plutella xylostella TaxID=51655 RepID=A0A8S4EES1_PLUXY|nr:unnamed protein product [Plutella xylostella]